MDTLSYGGFGDSGEGGYLAGGFLFEVEVEDFAVGVVVETFYQFVEQVVQVVVVVGYFVVEVLVEGEELDAFFAVAEMVDGSVACDAVHPGVDAALALEGGPLLPKGDQDVLEEVGEVVGVATGIELAQLYQCAFALVDYCVEPDVLLSLCSHFFRGVQSGSCVQFLCRPI